MGPSGKVKVGTVTVAETPEEVGVVTMVMKQKLSLTSNYLKVKRVIRAFGLELDYHLAPIQEMRDKKVT